jgi:hypothetical protein
VLLLPLSLSSSYVTFAAAAGRAKVCKFLLQSSRPTSCAGHHSAFALFSSSVLARVPCVTLSLLTHVMQFTGLEQSWHSYVCPYVPLYMPFIYSNTSAMFSFLSALGYSLSVFDEDRGSFSPLSAADAAAFNNESRFRF